MNHTFRHLRIAVYVFVVAVSFGLDSPCGNDSLADVGTRFAGRGLGYVLERHRSDFALDVYAVEQWARNLVHVALYLPRRADTMVGWVSIITAGAGIHGGHKHERAREVDVIFGAGDVDLPVFEWLAQHFERVFVEFRQFVAEEHTVVCQ